MNVAGILAKSRKRLDDETGASSDRLWKSEEIIDDYANEVIRRLCRICRGLIVDSSTALDPNKVPMCQLTLSANIKGVTSPYVWKYDISPYILEIERVKLASQNDKLPKSTSPEMDMAQLGWENADPAGPLAWLNDTDTDKIAFWPPPATATTAALKVWRLPLSELAISDLVAVPEIPLRFHDDIVPGILQMAFEKNDEETFRPGLAQKYEAKFLARAEFIKQELINQVVTVTTNSTRKAFR